MLGRGDFRLRGRLGVRSGRMGGRRGGLGRLRGGGLGGLGLQVARFLVYLKGE